MAKGDTVTLQQPRSNGGAGKATEPPELVILLELSSALQEDEHIILGRNSAWRPTGIFVDLSRYGKIADVVSKKHLLIYPGRHRFVVFEGAKNPTYYNGEEMRRNVPYTVEDEFVVNIGKIQINVRLSSDSELKQVKFRLFHDQNSAIFSKPMSIPEVLDESVSKELDCVFALAHGEFFEDGVETEFSNELGQFLRFADIQAVRDLHRYLEEFHPKPSIVSEALRWIGLDTNPSTHQTRLQLLVSYLGSDSSYIRDGANLGLSFMDDPRVIPYLEEAISHEEIDQLRTEMIQVLNQLRETAGQ